MFKTKNKVKFWYILDAVYAIYDGVENQKIKTKISKINEHGKIENVKWKTVEHLFKSL